MKCLNQFINSLEINGSLNIEEQFDDLNSSWNNMAAGELFTTPSKHIRKKNDRKAIIAMNINRHTCEKCQILPFLCPFWDKPPADSIKSPSDLEISLFIWKFYQYRFVQYPSTHFLIHFFIFVSLKNWMFH